MKLRDLPGFPQPYLDFVDSRTEGLPLPMERPGRDALLQRTAKVVAAPPRVENPPRDEDIHADSPAASGNLHLLRRPGTVAVVAGIRAGEFGGPMQCLLQCLTAVKLASSLGLKGYPAVPVLWVDTEARGDDGNGLDVLDGDGQLIPIHNEKLEVISSIMPQNIKNTESYRSVERAYGNGATLPGATTDFYSDLLGDLGVVVVEGGAKHAAVLAGTVAYVVAPPDIGEAALLPRQFEAAGIIPPLLWPSMSATLLDSRSRKMLERFRLGLRDLFDGTGSVLSRIDRESDEAGTRGALQTLSAEIDSHLQGLAARVPEGHALAGTIEDSRSRMQYQISKVLERYESSVSVRREASVRQVTRLCNSLAPRGKRQEVQLAAIHFVLRYSRALLSEIVTKSDVWDFQHQLIPLD
jgi:uncharacterized protein YllA (UPF0747 family)